MGGFLGYLCDVSHGWFNAAALRELLTLSRASLLIGTHQDRYFGGNDVLRLEGATVNQKNNFIANDRYFPPLSHSALTPAEITKRIRRNFEGTRIFATRREIGVWGGRMGKVCKILDLDRDLYHREFFRGFGTGWDL